MLAQVDVWKRYAHILQYAKTAKNAEVYSQFFLMVYPPQAVLPLTDWNIFVYSILQMKTSLRSILTSVKKIVAKNTTKINFY